ncbi:MAG TPA: sporulation protein YabP [Firmicutes bacterium]|nr:sporulation protein YabP [Bacillales bacterium]HJA41476.1 sporulation protein YabP [Bacillota bacterium]
MNEKESRSHSDEHKLVVQNRKIMDITGVKGIGHFDAMQFILDTTMGYLMIQGHEMEMKGFDKQKGTVCIHGNFHAWEYRNEKPGEKTKNLLGKLFK